MQVLKVDVGRQGQGCSLASYQANTNWSSCLDEIIEDGSGRTLRETLEEKHPDASSGQPEAIWSDELTCDDFHPVLFDSITAEVIRDSALHTEGAASGVDAMSWRWLCTAFVQKSNDLCSVLAAFAQRICTTYIDPSGLIAYTSCCLIPLDKYPGVRPIGIGEVVHRIIGKSVMQTIKHNLQDAIGSFQLCAGQDAGCEAAFHALKYIFTEDDTEAVILVDATCTNVFNKLNRQVTLLNCQAICPSMSPILTNTYRSDSWLFVGGQCMKSKEGTTQGDPSAMAMYMCMQLEHSPRYADWRALLSKFGMLMILLLDLA